jgi:hypothetical protein
MRANSAVSLTAEVAVVAENLKIIRISVFVYPAVKRNAAFTMLFPEVGPIIVDVIDRQKASVRFATTHALWSVMFDDDVEPLLGKLAGNRPTSILLFLRPRRKRIVFIPIRRPFLGVRFVAAVPDIHPARMTNLTFVTPQPMCFVYEIELGKELVSSALFASAHLSHKLVCKRCSRTDQGLAADCPESL